jgi:hypothetical protein
MQKKLKVCPTCLRPFNSENEALQNLLDRNYPTVTVEVEEKPKVEPRKLFKPRKEEPEETEDEDLRLEE